MRTRRLKLNEVAVYHCMSRTVNGAALFQSAEKEALRKMIYRIADFSGVEVLTYCLMNNHFHVLVRVSPADDVSDEELIRRYRVLYPKPTRYQMASLQTMAAELASGSEAGAEIRDKLLARMGDVSAFMKTLKQRFSTWFNKTHDRFGPLWSDRFKSVLVEGAGNALQTVAAYIDLNPVRAGIVDDPKDYRFCGYAEAVVGRKASIHGLKLITSGLYEVPVGEALAAYRCMLFGKGSASEPGSVHIDRARAVRVLEKEQGQLSAPTLLRCRIRYFSEGAVLGSRAFIQSHADNWRRSTGRKYPPKPKSIHYQEAPPIEVMRGVRGSAYS